MVSCPKCGHERYPKDDELFPQNECPKCGIIYEKFAEMQRQLNDDKEFGFVQRNDKRSVSFYAITICLCAFAVLLIAVKGRYLGEKNSNVKKAQSEIVNQSRSDVLDRHDTIDDSHRDHRTTDATDHIAINRQFYNDKEGTEDISNSLVRLTQKYDQQLNQDQYFHNTLYMYQWRSIESSRNYSKIQSILINYHRQHTYMGSDFFACLDMATDVWNILTTAGIRARLMVGNVNVDITDHSTVREYIARLNHAWVLAEVLPSYWIPLETTGGFVVEPYKANFDLYNRGTMFENPKECKDYNISRNAMFDTCNETVSMVENFNRLYAGKPVSRETTEYTGRMKQKLEDCDQLVGKVTAFLQRGQDGRL